MLTTTQNETNQSDMVQQGGSLEKIEFQFVEESSSESDDELESVSESELELELEESEEELSES